MMHNVNVKSPPLRVPVINERMRVSPRVRLPGGDMDWDYAIPIPRTAPFNRKPRSQVRKERERDYKEQANKERLGLNTTGITLKSLFLTTMALSVALGMALLLQLSTMMEKSKETNALLKSIDQIKAHNQQLEVDLAAATEETDVAYISTQRLGLIAAKGAQSVYIQVPDRFLQIQANADADTPPVPNGAYAAFLGFMD